MNKGEMTKDKIKLVLERELWANKYSVLGIDAAVKAIAALLKPQPGSRSLSVLFDELHDALEDVQLCDNTADEAERAWGEIAGIVEEFKNEAIATLLESQSPLKHPAPTGTERYEQCPACQEASVHLAVLDGRFIGDADDNRNEPSKYADREAPTPDVVTAHVCFECGYVMDIENCPDAPVDRVQAMAALVYSPVFNVFLVPDAGQYVVRNDNGVLRCHRCAGDCDHVRAVRIHIANQGK